MANIVIKDGAGNTKYLKAAGAGTDIDPHVPEQAVSVTGVATAANQVSALTLLQALADALGGTLTVDAGTVTVTGPLTDAQLRATPVPVTVGAALPAGTNSIGGTKDNGPQWTSAFGVAGVRFTSANQSATPAAVTDAPTAGQKLVITDVLISVDTAMRVDLREETTNTVVASLYLPANGTAQITPRSKLKLATADKKLMVQTSASGNVAVTAFFFSET